MPIANSIIRIEDVTKTFYLGKDVKVSALNGISLDLKQGDFVSITGPSGSGKTTLLNVLSAMLRPTTGEVFIRGKPISRMNDSELAQVRGKTIGFVFQKFNLINRMTALENVMLPLWFQGLGLEKRKARAAGLLDGVGLHDRMNHKPNELSGGQQQRVAIARALAVDPEIIIADEPTGNLDSQTGDKILELIEDLNRGQGKTVLMVTHEREIAERAQRIVHIRDGAIERHEALKRKIP